tara:strand:- start:7 stop:459 length:453 start_codon:yes stop_codon:yes gene_type:complete
MILIKNIFDSKDRKEFIKRGISYLKDWGDRPGKQTTSDMHLKYELKGYYDHILGLIRERIPSNLIIDAAWINWTNGKKKDMGWHNHPTSYSAVYYMKTLPFFSNGTLFEDGFIKTPQNSLLIFPSHLKHSAPSSLIPFGRYTTAVDLKII